VAAAPAAASSTQVSILQDNGLTIEANPAVRGATLDEFKRLGADVVKVQVHWREIAPLSKPAGFDATDPASYPDSKWQPYDSFVMAVVARGMRPFLSLGGGRGAPYWATSGSGPYRKVTRPSNLEFERFATAVGRRYSGSYAGLPRVTWWSIWSEPNLVSMLSPIRSSSGTPLSPVIYRNLYLAGRRGLVNSGHGQDRILMGELNPAPDGSATISPVVFLREMGCLDSNWRAYTGSARTARGCPVSPGPLSASGLAHHPYNGPNRSPLAAPRSSGDVGINYLSRLTQTIDNLYSRGRLTSKLSIWITEYGFQTNPPDPTQNPIGNVPGYMDESEWIAYRNPRVSSYAHYQLVDEPPGPVSQGSARWSGFQTGLRFANGQAKLAIYNAFRTPFFAYYTKEGEIRLFGSIRFAPSGSVVWLESRLGTGPWTLLGQPRLSSSGYFNVAYKVSNVSSRKYRFRSAGLTREKAPVRR
jgi:hypothetical protein